MRSQPFKISLVLIAVLVALSATPSVGAMIGVFFGMAIAFFVAPLAFALHHLAQAAGITIAFDSILHILLGLYGLCVLLGLLAALRRLARSEIEAARLAGAKMALFAALPLAGYLSASQLARAWP